MKPISLQYIIAVEETVNKDLQLIAGEKMFPTGILKANNNNRLVLQASVFGHAIKQ